MDPIRQWFVDHDGSDFATTPRIHPYSVVPPALTSHRILYTTKPSSVLMPFSYGSLDCPCGVIGRCSLPNDSDVDWLRSFADGRPFLYLGDADPCDLLIFAWLRSRIDISFRGLSDALFEECGVTLNDRITIAQSDIELAAMEFVTEHVPDYAELLGQGCATVLNSGRKLELESLISFATVEPIAMVNAMVG